MSQLGDPAVIEVSLSTDGETTQTELRGDAASPDEGEHHVHRLVQDENAKTILLNVPLEISTSSLAFETTSTSSGSNCSSLTSSLIATAGKPPRKPSSSQRGVTLDLQRKKTPRDESAIFKLFPKSTAKSSPRGRSTRARSASVGRGGDKKSDLQARYWAFLFENVRRAVDDLYRTCESDESVPATKEVILVFENYVRDFSNLANWLKLKWEYENTPPPRRPTSLAWEIRKTPQAVAAVAKPTPTGLLATQRLLMATPAKRALDFDGSKEMGMNGGGDASRAAGGTKAVLPPEVIKEVQELPPLGDEEKPDQDEAPKPDCCSQTNPKDDKSVAIKASASTEDRPISSRQKITRVSKSASSGRVKPSSVDNVDGVSMPKSESRSVSSSAAGRCSIASSRHSSSGNAKSSTKSFVVKKNDVAKAEEGKGGIAPSSRRESRAKTAQGDGSPKTQRLSLVQRQAKFAASVEKPVNRQPLVRSATASSISVARLKQPAAAAKLVAPSSTQRKSNAGTSAPSVPPKVVPFGSTSSISSSCSNRSWADTVKGLKASTPSPSAINAAAAVAEVAAPANNVDSNENDGWETVRPRTRQRTSPFHGSGSDRCNGPTPRQRFHVLSSSVSLPSLSVEAANAKMEPTAKLKTRQGRRERNVAPPTNLEKVTESHLESSTEKLPPGEESDKTAKPPTAKRTLVSAAAAAAGRAAATEKGKSNVTADSARSNSKSSRQQLSEGKANRAAAAAAKAPVVVNTPNKENSVPNGNATTLTAEEEEEEAVDSEIAKHEAAIALVEKEEENLAREIRETERSELVDDNDAATTTTTTSGDSDCSTRNEKEEEVASVGVNLESIFEGMSWADQVELEEQLVESRYPGRAIQLHEKLSSPARKREPQEAFRHHQEKQNKARVRRQMFQEEKGQKLAALNARIEEVIAHKEVLMGERRQMIDRKMARAEVKRQEHIDGIRRKAREEDAKLKEIAFINELQAQNARIDMLVQNQAADEKVEERLAEIAGERAKKAEQREAKEARAEERRKAIEEKRRQDVEALRQRIRSRDERIQEEQQHRIKAREQAAREKNRDRVEKLSTVRAAEKDMKEELQEKLQQKMDEATKRHQERLDNIRNKAFELSVQGCSSCEKVPMLQAYDPKKKCGVCDVLIVNEVQLLSHLRGPKHCDLVSQANGGRKLSAEDVQRYNLGCVLDAALDEPDPKRARTVERGKAMKKRVKKLKARMAQRGAEFSRQLVPPSIKFDSPNRAKISKSLRDIEKLLSSQGKGAWPDSLASAVERALGEIGRALKKESAAQDNHGFYALGGFAILSRLFEFVSDQKHGCPVPLKSMALCCDTWKLACTKHRPNTVYVLKSNNLTQFVDVLVDRLQILVPEPRGSKDCEILPAPRGPQIDPVALAVMELLAQSLEDLSFELRINDDKIVGQSKPEDLVVRVQDQVSYVVSVGLVDKLASYFHLVQDPIDHDPKVGEFLLAALELLSSLTGCVEMLSGKKPSSDLSGDADPTHLLTTLRLTELAGTVSMLYGILLRQGMPPREKLIDESPPPKLPAHTLGVVEAATKILIRMVRQCVTTVQEVLGQEGISLEFRHIASYLIWYCQKQDNGDLLHRIVVLIGYFAAKHSDNQAILQSGHQPSVLQQLCNLPFPYFSQAELKRILFPTLLACCHDNAVNVSILQEEMSWQLIEDFLNGPDNGKAEHLAQLVLSTRD